MTTAVAVALAGAAGAVCRYLVDGIVQERWKGPFPMGTFVVNVTGSFLLGTITGIFLMHPTGAEMKTIVGVGFLGAYTTFSTLTYESLRLAREGAGRYALANVVGTTVAGLLTAWVGLVAGRHL